MWRNIFIESCILSLLVFGGFYINANFLKAKITESEEKVNEQTDQSQPKIHISGTGFGKPISRKNAPHISGSKGPVLPPSTKNPTLGVGTP